MNLRSPAPILATILVWVATSATAAEPSAEGSRMAAACAACHGPGGVSANPEWPKLAGQHRDYLLAQMIAIKDGTRAAPLMFGQLNAFDEGQMGEIADYFAAEAPSIGEADPLLVGAGERLYRGGNAETGVPACMACHGPEGLGNGPAGWPALGGQHAAYVMAQLRAYRSGDRSTDLNQMMRNVAARMSDSEIEAVASYVQGLE